MKLIPDGATRLVARQVLIAKKNSPHFFFAGGLVGVLGATVLACRATLRLEENLDDVRADLQKTKTNAELAKSDPDEAYTDQDYYKDIGQVYIRSLNKFGRLYGPAVVVGGVSIAALTGSHIQLARRNTALTITLAAVSKAYEDYRIRVQEAVGREKEQELYHAVRTQEIDGEGKKKDLVKAANPNEWSPYARFFDETSPNFVKNAEYNRTFIEVQQTYANHKLRSCGHLFLNEVYDSLGFERTPAGAVVGWLWNSEEGDNYIDFGLYEAYNVTMKHNAEPRMLLDFNVDGIIYEKI